MMRIALSLAYDGHAFYGWQDQRDPQYPTVQQEVEAALSRVANHPVYVICAGRTDAGVHASYQIVHFDTSSERDLSAWVRGTNRYLSSAVHVNWARHVSEVFHARYAAKARCYRYIIYNHPVRTSLLRNYLTWEYRPLVSSRMQEAANHLLGKHNFSAFRGSGCQAKHANRNVLSIRVWPEGDAIVIEIWANAFLLHMVRNIMGVLLAVGCGERSSHWAKEVLESKQRCMAGITASSHGLYLADVIYPECYQLPQQVSGPLFVTAAINRPNID